MTDVVTFRIARAPRRADESACGLAFAIPQDEESVLVTDLVGVLSGAHSPEEKLKLLTEVAVSFIEGPNYVNPLTPRRRVESPSLLELLQALDSWLVGKLDDPEADELESKLAEFVEALRDGERQEQWAGLRRRLGESLVAATAARLSGEIRRGLIRLILLAELVDRRISAAAALDYAEAFDVLRRSIIVLPSPPFPVAEHVGLPRKARLARDPAFSDLYVVRDEWRCYLPGEISHIENVLLGEKKSRRHRRVDETEQISVVETDRLSVETRESQTTDRFELAEETQSDTNLTIGLDGQVDTSGRYGPTQVDTHVAANLEFSVAESKRRATQQAREVVGTAATRIEQRVRQVRSSRTLSRIEESNSHLLDNRQGDGHVRGVYRWVDKVQRLQVFRYPHRYLLEVQIPEPAALRRSFRPDQTIDVGVEKPPAPPHSASLIDPSNYQQFVADFHASGAPAPPDASVAVSHSLVLQAAKEQLPANAEDPYNPPVLTKSDTLAIPPGYGAVRVDVDAAASPVRADWVREFEINDGSEVVDQSFHRVEMDVTVGHHNFRKPTEGQNAVQGQRAPRRQLGDAFLAFEDGGVFDAPVLDKVAVGVLAHGAGGAAVTVRLKCVPLVETMTAWQNAVYDVAVAAWTAWKRQYDEARAAVVLKATPVPTVSGLRAKEIIREELKRQFIEMLKGERFDGFDALTDARPPRIDIDAAAASAAEIQFIEQAFEWQNLTYALYQYYWADAGRWKDLADLDGADPEFARFLRSGSARVVVPARPGFEESVNHYLVWGEPWEGGPAPVPGSRRYISVAKEIQELTGAPDDGEPGDSWEVRLPTSLLWLDDSADLPSNPAGRLGTAPHAPADPICES